MPSVKGNDLSEFESENDNGEVAWFFDGNSCGTFRVPAKSVAADSIRPAGIEFHLGMADTIRPHLPQSPFGRYSAGCPCAFKKTGKTDSARPDFPFAIPQPDLCSSIQTAHHHMLGSSFFSENMVRVRFAKGSDVGHGQIPRHRCLQGTPHDIRQHDDKSLPRKSLYLRGWNPRAPTQTQKPNHGST